MEIFFTVEWAVVCVSMFFVIETVKAKGENGEGEQGYRVHVVVDGVCYTKPQYNQRFLINKCPLCCSLLLNGTR